MRQTTVIVLLAILGRNNVVSFNASPILTEYDFIVVGAGPGGAVVARRLSENPNWTVLLLEAGESGNEFLYIPAFLDYSQTTQYNWKFETEPQPGACLGLKRQRCRWPRGRGLGGSSLLNAVIYTRGNEIDYDLWAEEGNTGWSYDEVEPYFLKSENIQIPELENSPYHHKGGPLTVENIPFQSKLSVAFLEAAQELGYKIIDYNDGSKLIGFAKLQDTMRNGRRVSSYTSFLRPIQKRPNLQISINSMVTKVLINPDTKTAEGVEMVRDNKTYSVKVRKEVILSAGAIQTPQLLMLSGVGPKAHLEELGIPVLEDLPVGDNLHDHVTHTGLVFLVTRGVAADPPLIESLFDFFDNGTGPLTIPTQLEAVGFVSTKLNDDPCGRPDMELLFVRSSSAANQAIATGTFGMKDEIYAETFRPIQNRTTWTIYPILLHPKSRGSIRLRNANPFYKPKIFANFFENEHDLDTMVEGIKMAIQISETKAFEKFGTTLSHIPLKDCVKGRTKFGSDEYYRCAVRLLTATIYHPAGTAKMGPASDPAAVVNPQLQVRRTKNLRVVDASIIPQLPSAHPQAPVYMIAEKASDMIKAAWNTM